MCVCGWQLITLGVVTQLLIITYGELEGRRRANTGRHHDQPPGRMPVPERNGPQA